MSAKVPDGLLYDKEFLIKLPYGGWLLGRKIDLDYLFTPIRTKHGWEWQESDEEYYKGAAPVAPLNILVWSEQDE